MTKVWRPRVRIDVPDVGDVENTDTSREESTKKGTKRKRAPMHFGPCEHGVKYRSRCKVCSGCPHGRRRSQCKECGGGSICEHGRQRHVCKECGGSQICEHGRIRSKCKECGGTSICEHGRVRSRCKECGGGSICEHGHVRYNCKECIASRRGQRTADVSRGAPSQHTEQHARQDTDVDEPSEASENEEPDDPTEVDAAEAAHATTRLAQSGLPGLARYQDAVSSIELRNRRAVIVEQTRALKRRLVGDVDPTAQADEDERDEDERDTEEEGEQRRCVIM